MHILHLLSVFVLRECLSEQSLQKNKCGWETWFTMKYGADLSKLRTPVFAQRTVDIEKALEKAESDLRKVVEML